MCNEEPKVNPDATFGVKETCALLGMSKNTLADRRRKGKITPVNPQVRRWYRYSGEAIRRLWRTENNLPT